MSPLTIRASLAGSCALALLLARAAAQDPAPPAADPFATTDAMLDEGGRQGVAAGLGAPVVVLHAFLELEGRAPAALISVSGTRPRLVRRGDVVSVQPGGAGPTSVTRAAGRARPPAADEGDGDVDTPPREAGAPAPAAGATGARPLLVLEVLDVADGAVTLEVRGAGLRLTVQR